MPIRFWMPNPMRVRRAARSVAVSAALLLGFLAPGYPVEAAGEPRPDTAPFGTMVVNGFLVPIPGPTNDQLVMHPVARISGDLAPKSVVASGTGLYLAQNMMYRHTISVLDHTKHIVKTIDDSVNLREFGYDALGDVYRGAPVEAAFTSDGSFAFVSNYRMYGPGYDPQAGSDRCGRDQGQDSFVYRIDTAALEIDRVYPVGPVPKHLAVTPDNRLLVVSNWCGFDVTVIDLVTHETLAEIDVGRHPRGVAITRDGRTAYVAVMGSTGVAAIDLTAFAPENGDTGAAGQPAPTYIRDVGISPRHLVLSPDGRTLYATLNGEDTVVAVDLDSGQVIRRIRTGQAPRSMDISSDGHGPVCRQLQVAHREQDPDQRLHGPPGVRHDSQTHRDHLRPLQQRGLGLDLFGHHPRVRRTARIDTRPTNAPEDPCPHASVQHPGSALPVLCDVS